MLKILRWIDKTTLEKGGRLLGVDLGGVDYFRASSIFSQYLPMTDRLVLPIVCLVVIIQK